MKVNKLERIRLKKNIFLQEIISLDTKNFSPFSVYLYRFSIEFRAESYISYTNISM